MMFQKGFFFWGGGGGNILTSSNEKKKKKKKFQHQFQHIHSLEYTFKGDDTSSQLNQWNHHR